MTISYPFPLAAASAVVHPLRALYRDERSAGASSERLAHIAEVGKRLAEAIDLARRGGPGSLGERAAWRRAEDATGEACAMLGDRVCTPGCVQAVQKIRREAG
jgi:hypothetical protein